MTFRRMLAAALAVVSLGAVAAVEFPSPAGAANTTETPVMGPNLLNANQLVNWYSARQPASLPPRIPMLNNDVRALAQLFIDEGAVEGVRGDMAFVQAVIETSGFNFPDFGQIRPEFNNYGGINATDGRRKGTTCAEEVLDAPAPSRCFATPQIGVRANIHLLRSYADATSSNLPDRIRQAPSDRRGYAPIFELFGGEIPDGCGQPPAVPCQKLLVWASSQTYATTILSRYSDALVFNGARAECLPYFPGAVSNPSGSGYWVVGSDGGVFSFGSAGFHGSTGGMRLNSPVINAESVGGGTGYWLVAGDGGVFSFDAPFYGSTGAMRLNKPVNGMERTDNNGGYWLVASDGGIFAYGNAPFFGSTGAMRLNKPVLGMERTKSGNGYWLFASDGGIFSFGDAAFFGSLGGQALTAPITSMQRTASGNGYWMLGADGKVYAFGDAVNFGNVAGCSNYGYAMHLLVTPSGGGYWIQTSSGAVVAFGDARRLGFPSRMNGIAVAMMSAG